jgi:hypothetical protein
LYFVCAWNYNPFQYLKIPTLICFCSEKPDLTCRRLFSWIASIQQMEKGSICRPPSWCKKVDIKLIPSVGPEVGSTILCIINAYNQNQYVCFLPWVLHIW